LVNGKVVNIPSYQLNPDDVISVSQKSKAQLRIKSAMEIASQREVEWIEVNPSNMEGILKRIPDRDDLPTEINESLIVELYSK
jgi:small subunit ribosomal protein S4